MIGLTLESKKYLANLSDSEKAIVLSELEKIDDLIKKAGIWGFKYLSFSIDSYKQDTIKILEINGFKLEKIYWRGKRDGGICLRW